MDRPGLLGPFPQPETTDVGGRGSGGATYMNIWGLLLIGAGRKLLGVELEGNL